MPLKSYLQIAFLSLLGLCLIVFLLRYIVRSWKDGRKKSAVGGGFLLAGMVSATLIACAWLLPCFNLLENAYCAGPKPEKWLALTFDDGPNEPYTSQILDVLQRYQVPATFFLVGENAQRHPDLVRRMRSEGHAIGNHTLSHQKLIFLPRAELDRQIGETDRILSDLGVGPIRLFRAPHGHKSMFLSAALSKYGYRLIGWTRGVWDSDRPGVNVLYERLTSNLRNGEIILLHDGESNHLGADRSQTVEVLPKILDYYLSQGFRLVTVDEMLRNQSRLPVAAVSRLE